MWNAFERAAQRQPAEALSHRTRRFAGEGLDRLTPAALDDSDTEK